MLKRQGKDKRQFRDEDGPRGIAKSVVDWVKGNPIVENPLPIKNSTDSNRSLKGKGREEKPFARKRSK